MSRAKDLLIVGASSFAEIATLYFSRTDEYVVKALVVEDDYWEEGELLGLPIISLSEALGRYSPRDTFFFAAIVYSQMNQLRTRLMNLMMSKGFRPASYISPDAYIDDTASVGHHSFIFEDNTVQPFVSIGSNVVLWSGNHIGHHSVIDDNVFVSSHVVISGHCRVSRNTFLGVNCAIGNNVVIGEYNWIMPSTAILSDTGPRELWRPQPPVKSQKLPPGI